MDQAFIVRIVQEALLHAIILAMPMLGVSLVVGLTVAVFQSTTSIQEQTLSFVPKVLSIILSLIVFGPWILMTLMDYTSRLWGLLEVLSR